VHPDGCPSPRGKVKTIYGTRLCEECAKGIPERFIAGPPAIFGWKDTQHGARVDVTLRDMNTTNDIYWSRSKNSYVLAEVRADSPWLTHPKCADYYFQRDGRWFCLVSINGCGEVRWSVTADRLAQDEDYEEVCEAEGRDHHGDGVEQLAAARHFNLIPAR
jgi:hypothetical protein